MKESKIDAGRLGKRNDARTLVAIALVTMSLACVTPVEEPPVERAPLECSPESLFRLGTLDVAIAIDNSITTQVPSGIDVDGDGVVGILRESIYTDRDDSLLGVQLTAIRKLIRDTEPHDVKYSILTYSGFPIESHQSRNSRAVRRLDARTLVEKTNNQERLEAALGVIERDSSRGSSQIYAGLRRATESLIKPRDRERESRKVVLFISDTPGWISYENGRVAENQINAKIAVAVREAEDLQIVFNTFGLTQDSVDWDRVTIGLVAAMTGGRYHAIDEPEHLYCHLVDSLLLGTDEVTPEFDRDLGL